MGRFLVRQNPYTSHTLLYKHRSIKSEEIVCAFTFHLTSEVRGVVDVWVSGEQLTENEPAHLDEAEERLGAEHTMVLVRVAHVPVGGYRSEEHTSELQSP